MAKIAVIPRKWVSQLFQPSWSKYLEQIYNMGWSSSHGRLDVSRSCPVMRISIWLICIGSKTVQSLSRMPKVTASNPITALSSLDYLFYFFQMFRTWTVWKSWKKNWKNQEQLFNFLEQINNSFKFFQFIFFSLALEITFVARDLLEKQIPKMSLKTFFQNVDHWYAPEALN